MYCGKCGNEIAPQSKFCSKCGYSVTLTSNEAAASNSTVGYILTINRAKQWFAINPAVRIVIDRNVEYKIDNGVTLNIPITAGAHNIAFSCNIRNKIVNINATSNVTLNIKWNRITGSLEVE